MLNIKEKLATIMAIPKEVALDLPMVIATGRREVIIENFKNLLEFSETYIKLRTKEGEITLEGNNLIIRQFTTESLVVSGQISSILYT